ncbi:MAG: hypothetical protein BGO98_42120 [Myxococcales bacterium 68-20]|nr:MAG: hypothetical protein BGO98_42120 [Myxococcales bacterium 68-20]
MVESTPRVPSSNENGSSCHLDGVTGKRERANVPAAAVAITAASAIDTSIVGACCACAWIDQALVAMNAAHAIEMLA